MIIDGNLYCLEININHVAVPLFYSIKPTLKLNLKSINNSPNYQKGLISLSLDYNDLFL